MEPHMAKIAIVYHSGYGHTAKVAEHVATGIRGVEGIELSVLKADDLADPENGPWDTLHAADATIFGAPTYMGSASGVMKQFMDATSKAWMEMKWKDKIAAGFTNSGSLSGDKVVTLQQFATLAAQQGMIWVGTGMMPGYNMKGSDFETAQNRAGFAIGLGTQALVDASPEESPDTADLETAEAFGERVALATKRWVAGKA